MKKKVTMDKLVSLCKRRGFVYSGSDIYGGLANSWDYGPLGAQLKMNIKQVWWKTFVESRQDMVGLDGAILMNPRIWEASGHVANFSDPMVEDMVTHKRYRADDLVEKKTGEDVDGWEMDKIDAIIKEKKILSPDGNPLSEAKTFNLMFETYIGKTEGEKEAVYLRPETAQAIFVNFKNVLDSSRMRLPFGVGQIGKAFRNEITPGNFIFRTLEFEQMEIEYFVEEKDWEPVFDTWLINMEAFADNIGLAKVGRSRYEHPVEKLSHYSKKTVDVMFAFPFGVKELWGLAYRTDFDLKNHEKHSQQKLHYTDPQDPTRKFTPHVVEPTFGVDRTLLALLVSAYDEEEVGEEKRVVMRFKPHMAPIQVAVLPLMKKGGLVEKAEALVDELSKQYRIDLDVTGSIGKRYRRQDEIGTPYCITVDPETLEDGKVTVRDRDTMEQERVDIQTLKHYFAEKLI
jgi:glycyl-tRNA synthetase